MPSSPFFQHNKDVIARMEENFLEVFKNVDTRLSRIEAELHWLRENFLANYSNGWKPSAEAHNQAIKDFCENNGKGEYGG